MKYNKFLSEIIMKVVLLVTIWTIGGQAAREYLYNTPNLPFRHEDTTKQQSSYVMPYGSMSIAGKNGHNFEISMAPARNIFEMHLGHHQYYTQDKAINSVGHNQRQLKQLGGGGYPYPQHLLNRAISQSHSSSAYPQQSASAYSQQQITYNPIAASTSNFPSVITSSPHIGSASSNQLNPKPRPSSRIFKVCYTSGRCEYVYDNQQLQRLLQQSRTKLPSSSSPHMPQPLLMQLGFLNAGSKVQRNRRLFPYSEVLIDQYPFKK